jgi:hypothetical protein
MDEIKATCCGGSAECGPSQEISAELKKTGSLITLADRLGWLRVRLGFRRNDFRVDPGIYALGNPGPFSPVLVSANYKLSFDKLREALAGLDAYILVLDTRGINVWCAAGKGTFGTTELVARIQGCGLATLVTHRTVILPQLGAPGVAAHEVKKATGFKVIWGPVQARDIRAFIGNGLKASEQMRTVTFRMGERFILTPVEFVQGLPYFLLLAPIALGLEFLSVRSLTPGLLFGLIPFFIAYTAGTVLVPLLLPVLPGRALSFKGWFTGLLLTAAWNLLAGASLPVVLSSALLFPALSAFLAMNFTGATTYTSLSGVVREMKIAVPLIIVSAAGGIAARTAGYFLQEVFK